MYQESRGRRPSTTMQIASESYTGLCAGWSNRTASYTYDAMGNIATITGPYKNKKSVQRTYNDDAQNQLLSETIGSDTTSYTYDTAGNIRSITGPSVSKTFSYNDSGDWKDLLTSVTVNGTTRSITYEEENGVTIGNPLSYFNGTQYTLAWQNGRQLASLSSGGKSATYTYGADGIRTGKTVTDASGTTTYQYTTQNGQIARQSWTANGTAYQMDFIYDAAGRPLSMYYRSKTASQTDFNGDSYYYETNQQGDVTGLYKITYNATTNSLTATRVASYEYDAWGNVTYSTGTMAKINPLKYRGYYHDAESGFYYLQSRYYDPAIGRFVNADGYASTGEGFLGYNMFAYCNNDPVNATDSTGTRLTNDAGGGFAFAGGSGSSALIWQQAAQFIASLSALLAGKAVQMTLFSSRSVGKTRAVTRAMTRLTSKSYTVYKLVDETGQVQYIGRTVNVEQRRRAHERNEYRSGLTLVVIKRNLSYAAARGLEQTYMLHYHTLNTLNKMNNQINGISPTNVNKQVYIEAARGAAGFMWNEISNEIMCWAEGG